MHTTIIKIELFSKFNMFEYKSIPIKGGVSRIAEIKCLNSKVIKYHFNLTIQIFTHPSTKIL